MNSTFCFFVSDLHGHPDRYHKLFTAIEQEQPAAVFLGGDLLPSGLLNISSTGEIYHDFVEQVLYQGFARLRSRMGRRYPDVFLILGNDDGKFEEATISELAAHRVWHYAHNRRIGLDDFQVFGYSYIPPTPFALKDWERYDVSRFVDPGCSSPEEGYYSVPVLEDERRWATIQNDLEKLAQHEHLEKAIFLFHAPPYHTNLDRAALDGKKFDAVPLDVHVGSIAIRRFIETRQPYLTLHGHIHESARITGSWKDKIGSTYCFSAAHHGKELALVRFDLEHPENAMRELI
jgi:Icc-related predicted phosphoesterase